ncbi:MAG: M15 family metallopeptidase [Patescibacteria group bacterium]|nr:M15 family metallopeptidase [Patescibacteria group bacterium]
MTVGELQRKFAGMVGKLIDFAYAQGYELTFGEAYRTPEQAQLNAKAGTGIANSLHCIRLAVDLNLFKDGAFLAKVSDYLPLGEFWESLGGAWGGRFERPDADHFSLAYGGRK